MKGINRHCKSLLRVPVTEELTAKTMGSGALRVLATPAVIALMEKAACDAVSYFMEEGETTVGTAINIDHVAPSPVGAQIRVEASVEFFTDRQIVFRVAAYDETRGNLLASGTHIRVVVNAEKFQNKADRMVQK